LQAFLDCVARSQFREALRYYRCAKRHVPEGQQSLDGPALSGSLCVVDRAPSASQLLEADEWFEQLLLLYKETRSSHPPPETERPHLR